ncbi:hypothetical protein D3C81_833460 [compost metagenome]
MTEQTQAVAVPTLKIQVVAVVFEEGQGQKEYNYFAPADARTGQYAAVYSPQSTGFPFKIVRIVRDNVIDVEGKANKSIWGAFDETFAKAVQERTEHMAHVKSQLAQKRRQFEERELFTVMAKSDPEVAALLQELDGFQV